MRIQEITLYQYPELTQAAQARARDWYRSLADQDHDYADAVIEDFGRVAEILGITLNTHSVRLMGKNPVTGQHNTRQEPNVYWSGFCSQGAGACFEGQWNATPVHVAMGVATTCEKIKAYCNDPVLVQIARELDAHGAAGITDVRMVQSGHYCHRYSVRFDVYKTGLDADGDSEEIELFGDDAAPVIETFRDLMQWLYKALEAEYDYRRSEASVAEMITANAYEFDKEGNRV